MNNRRSLCCFYPSNGGWKIKGKYISEFDC